MELGSLDPHPRAAAQAALLVVAPGRSPAPSPPVADEFFLQPARRPVLARGFTKSVGDQHQRAVSQPRLAPRRAAFELVYDGFQVQLPPQPAQGCLPTMISLVFSPKATDAKTVTLLEF